MSKSYYTLKHLLKTLTLYKLEDIKEIEESYLSFKKDVENKINILRKFKENISKSKKASYHKLIKFFEEHVHTYPLNSYYELKENLENKTFSLCNKAYFKLNSYILKWFDRLDLNYTQKRDLIKIMISICVSPDYDEFNNSFKQRDKNITEKTWISRERETFRKQFPYYFWDETKQSYILSSLNVKDVRKPYIFVKKDNPINLFLKSKSPLLEFARKYMKKQATNPLNHKNQIYLSIIKFGMKNRIYVGKAKKSTRIRWGYGSGHLFEIFHYIIRGGEYNYPRQLSDLWTLYLGPSCQIILTLDTDIENKKLDNVEKAMQYYLDFNKEKYDIEGYLHNKLSYKNVDELPIGIKNSYREIEKIIT